jgi:pyruvate/2-oxoglutarate dehydrogenase complex dihydrolipoamide acyltransferase (E2) component
MSEQVILPKLGFSMTEGTVTEWLYTNGAEVTEGELLYLLESDKSVQEVEAPTGGTLRILKEAGETYPVGTVLAEID